MRERAEQFDVGVIVGRFQVHELHEGHRDLIQHVCDQHEKVLIFLGLSPLLNTVNNPLDFESRKQMILEQFPDVNVLYIQDMFDDRIWSAKLDQQIAAVVPPTQSVVLYGARDSFIDRYHGKHPTKRLEPERVFSGTIERKRVAKGRTKPSADFRAGVIWASQNRFPTAYTTVDFAPLNEDGSKVLLGRKPNEGQYRFLGGFSDPGSDSFEQDVRRECMEEAGIELGDITYIGSRKQDDWRYRGEADCIKTMMFVGKHIFGRPTPGDDIEEVRWFPLTSDTRDQMVQSHWPLINMLFNHLEGPQR